MDNCIHTPVKRQYINAFFETVVNQRKRVATIFNFLSSISIDIKWLSFNLGRKIFTALKWQNLEVTLPYFSSISLYKMSEKVLLQLSSSAISKPVKVFLPNLSGKPLVLILMNDKKSRIVATLLL